MGSKHHIRRYASLALVLLLSLPLVAQNVRHCAGAITTVISGGDHGGDFIAFYAAGQIYALRPDLSPYDLNALREFQLIANPSLRTREDWNTNRANGMRNPPFYLPIVGCFGRSTLPVAYALSTFWEALLLGALLALTAALVAERAPSCVAGAAWLGLALAYHHTWQGITYGQLPAYLVGLAFALGMVLLRAGQPLAAGLAWSLLWVKFQYLPAVGLYLLATREWRALRGLLAGTLILLVASLAAVGSLGFFRYLQVSAELANAPRGLYFMNYYALLNWRGLVEYTLANHPAAIMPLVTLLLALTYVFVWLAWTAPRAAQVWNGDLRLVLLSLTTILGSLHSHSQDLVLLLPGAALVAGHLWNEAVPWSTTLFAGLGLLLIAWALPSIPGWGVGRVDVVLLAVLVILVGQTLRTSC